MKHYKLHTKKPSDPVQEPKWDFGHRIRNFRRYTDIHYLRETLRNRVTSCYRKEYIKIAEFDYKCNAQEFLDCRKYHEDLEPLIENLQDATLQKAMTKVETLQQEYIVTSELQTILEGIKRERIDINISIICLEDTLVQCTLLQNFQYILKEPEWRMEHDWIHRKPNGQLEAFNESIEKRPTLNIRIRDNDDAYSVKAFFEQSYENRHHPVLAAFKDTPELLEMIQALKVGSFRALVELHFALWLEAETKEKLKKFQEWSEKDLAHKRQVVERRCNNKYFTEGRVAILKTQATKTMDQDLTKSLKKRKGWKTEAMLDNVMWHIVPARDREGVIKSLTSIEKVAKLESMVVQILEELDQYPRNRVNELERGLRFTQKRRLKHAQEATATMERIDNVIRGFIKNLQPPFRPPPREKPLPRSVLPPPPKKPKPPPPFVPMHQKLTVEAFTEKDVKELDFSTLENKQILRNIERNCMPFYFDYFLEQHGYIAKKDFVQDIVRKDGKEENRLKDKVLIPKIQDSVRKWEKRQVQIRQRNIQQTSYLYEDVIRE